MKSSRRIENRLMFLYWSDLSTIAEIIIIRSKRKTVEVSMTHLLKIIVKVPLDCSMETIRELVFKNNDAFKHHAMITAIRKLEE